MTDDAIQDDYRPTRRRRVFVVAGVLAALLAIGYWLSPYVAVARFAFAVHSGDTNAIVARMNTTALRNTFARQLVQAMIARNPQLRDLDPLRRQVVGGLAAGYVSAVIADYLSPEALAGLLAEGRAVSPAGSLIGEGSALPRINSVGRAANLLLLHSGFSGLDSFSVDPPDTGYSLAFGIRDGRWLLRSVTLPRPMLDRLADELASRSAVKPG